ncbi:MAG: hypothetical protein QXT68_04530 [Halobacteria archaeon]
MASPSFSDLLKEARSRLQSLDAQIAESRRKEDLGTRLERLERSLAETGTKVTTLATQVEGLGKAADALRKSRDIPEDLRARLARYDDAIADLSRRVSGERDTFVAYRQSVKQLVQATSAIKPGDFEGLRNIVEQHLSAYPEREIRVKNLEARMENLQTLQAKLQDLEVAVRKSVEGVDERLKAVGKVGEELERMKAGVVKEVGASGAKVERLREQTERLEGQVREVPALVKKEVDGALVGALGELWTKTKALEGEVAKAREEAARAGEGTSKSLQGLSSIEKEVWGCQARLRTAEEALQALRSDLARARDDLSDLKVEVRGAGAAAAKVERVEAAVREVPAVVEKQVAAALEETWARLEALEDDLARARESAERAGSAATRPLEGLQAFGGDLARAREEVADLKAEVKALRDLPGRLKEFETRFEAAPRLKEVEARLAPLENAARKLEGRLLDWSERFPGLEAKLKQMESRLEALEKSVVSLEAQRASTGPSVQDLRRQRQSVLALLETLKSGYEQKLLGKEEYEAIARENRDKIAELDAKISEMGGA